ncbi:MAG: molybdopterin-dependent oxidoreductase, partial [Acidobacteria bacterium]|nr:molybdopterin-dependent oxidoreductase [Acidobacteriota bacterium]
MAQPILEPTPVRPAVEGSRRIVASACPLDCPDACSLSVVVEDGRVTKLDGSWRNPLTAGFIRAKVRRWPEHMYGEARLLYPQVRRGQKGEGVFERVSWDEALELAASKLREARDRFGGESILPFSYGGSNGLLTQDTTDLRLFARLGASHLARTVCAAPSRSAAAGLYGRMAGVALSDYVHARLIVLWGVNPAVSGIHLVPVIQEAQRRGARLVVVDPRRTQLAKRADLHLAPLPGTDLPLALAAIRWLFEQGRADLDFLAAHAHGGDELRRRAAPWDLARAAAVCGVPAGDIESFARLFADSSPAVIRTGWGLERNRNGGSAVAAALALPAVGGKFGVRGGGYTMSNSAAWGEDHASASAVSPEDAARPVRTVNMNRLGQALLDLEPAVKVLFVYNCNPVATMPDQQRVRRGLEREDLFTVVFDPVRTDTARYADLLLPATTFHEHHELAKGYGALVLHRAAPAVQPVGEARPNYRVFAELCGRLGLAEPQDPEGEAALTAALLGGSPRVRAELARDGIAVPDCGMTPIQFVDVFPRTADRKVDLVPEALDREAPAGLYGYREVPAGAAFPLALISPATSRTISSTLGELHRKLVPVELHPDDAARRGLAGGDPVRVWNDHGEVRTALRLNPDLAPGVALLPKGLWSHNTRSGTTATALVADSLTDLG